MDLLSRDVSLHPQCIMRTGNNTLYSEVFGLRPIEVN